ncbi:MAG: hypothetical protein COV10_01275 [Candidatus Vogelbacteria bacterium CG10_big_fil_rev_8_21_14_0_10_51_16]|uniref:50S ribosomal protein L28 n=1 Tax=Candidatus Vogelbacteria bacterium CG10_big_fil_rev_8_21_14_0_10_51_16 TaxID=1975045 RepID=A0A2H0RF99_9BACT|nr:MAG: hypothetical protein COV10_01275 [Candidatus Vogelbacteria bacterium CG10_big_fil_rev_8_21_14_0_10_51_16]
MVGGYRNDVRATKYQPIGKRRKFPNLQWAKRPDGARVKICTTCMRKNKQLEIKAVGSSNK